LKMLTSGCFWVILEIVSRDPRGGHNRRMVDESFFKIWSPKMAYVLGYMFADGAILDTNTSSRTYYLCFASNDLDLLRKIRKTMNSNHRIYLRPPRIMSCKSKKYISKTGYMLRIGNKIMYQDLLSLGVTHNKSNSMHLPKIPTHLFSCFLRGYFDGDGCINLSLPRGRTTVRLRVIFSSGSTAFLNELALIISSVLQIRIPRIYQATRAFNLTTGGISAFKILEYIYKDLDKVPYLERKYRKYEEYRDNLMGSRVKKK